MRLTSPHNVLSAYSRGQIGSLESQAMLRLDSHRDLVIAMVDAGHALPKPSMNEVEAQVDATYDLLRSVLIMDRADA